MSMKKDQKFNHQPRQNHPYRSSSKLRLRDYAVETSPETVLSWTHGHGIRSLFLHRVTVSSGITAHHIGYLTLRFTQFFLEGGFLQTDLYAMYIKYVGDMLGICSFDFFSVFCRVMCLSRVAFTQTFKQFSFLVNTCTYSESVIM